MFGRRGLSDEEPRLRPSLPEIRPSQPEAPQPKAAAAPARPAPQRSSSVNESAPRISPLILQRIDTEVAAKLQREELSRQLSEMVSEIVVEQRIQLNQSEQRQLVIVLLDDMLGLGPLEPLLADE